MPHPLSDYLGGYSSWGCVRAGLRSETALFQSGQPWPRYRLSQRCAQVREIPSSLAP